MTRSRTPGRNSSSVSIRKAHLQRCATDTNEHEKSHTPTLSIEALQTIGRIVRAIKARIDVANENAEDDIRTCVADSGDRANIGALGGEDHDRAKKEKE